MRLAAGLHHDWRTVVGLRVHARVTAGRPERDDHVVLVHGVGVSGRYLLPTAARLAPFVRVHVPDLPGFGESARPPVALDVPAHADVLAAWLRDVGLERPTLLGNSMGCQVVVHLAARHPDLPGRAVLVGPTTDPDAASVRRQAWRLLRDGAREPVALDLLQIADYLRAGVRRSLRTARHAVRDPVAAVAREVHVPTLVVRGAEDPIVPQRWAEELTARLPRGRLVVVPGAPHVVNWVAADTLAELVLAFLDDPSAAVSPRPTPP